MTALALALLLWQPVQAETLSARALEAAQKQRFEEAEKLWKQALSLSPQLFSAAFNLGYLYATRGRHADAEPFLAAAVRARPGDFNARFLLGSTLAQLGRTDDALRQWREAIALQPANYKLMLVMAVEYGKGRYFREAAAIAERALAIKDDNPDAHLVAIKSWQDAGDHPAALRAAARFVRRFPEHPRARFEYGYELYRAGRPADSLPWIEKAMLASPDYEEPFFFYGETLMKEGRTGEAIAPLRRAIALKPGYMAARTTLARALMSLGRLEEAKSEMLRAIETDPRHPQPHLILSQIYFRLGDEAAAAREKEISLTLRRENPEAMEAPQTRPFPAR